MKDVGIVGLPYSGKSTLFTALTRVGSMGGRSHQAVVDVPDPRLQTLARIERSQKVVPAKIRFVDAPGGVTARALGEHRQTDALCIVLRAFGADADPSGDLATVTAELMLADLAIVESTLARARKRPEFRGEAETLQAAHAALSSERPLALDEDARKALRGYGLLTLKPWVIVANVGEDEAERVLPEGAVAINAEIEAEVAGMDPAEAAELLTAFDIAEPGAHLVIAACYGALDLVTFFTTTGEGESRAWEIRRGATAPEAAGVVHSDMERGFIRAEVVSLDELVAAGSWERAKAQGRVRTEGKSYVVADGDVIRVRFAV